MENNNLLASLTLEERGWLNLFEEHLKKAQDTKCGGDKTIDYIISWHVRCDTKIPTRKINYHLSKLVKKGILRSESCCYCTKFFYSDNFKNENKV